jgi:hypothetical protein
VGLTVNRLDPDSGSPVPPALDPAALYSALVEADDQGDAPGLARLAWALFALASKAEEVNGSVLEALTELTAAARAAIVGDGSVASLALLRHVLAKRGWLPPRDASPLQVLAAPAGDSRWQVRQLIADGAVAIGRSAAFSVPFAVPD